MSFVVTLYHVRQGTFGNLILQHVIGVSLFKSVWLSLAEGAAWGVWMPFVAAFVVDKWGRRKTEMFGWLFLAATQIINTGFFWQLKAQPIAWIIWSTFVGGFQNFVFIPVYLVPAEAFPTRIRATMYGIASSLGKMGGIVGTTTFPTIWRNWSGGVQQNDEGLRKTMWFYGGMEFLGLIICTFFVPEYSHRSLLGEDTRFVELRRRYAARFAVHWGVGQEQLDQVQVDGDFNGLGFLKNKCFSSASQYRQYCTSFAAYLARRENLLTKKRLDYVASLPVDYKDLTLFSAYWNTYRLGKQRYAEFLKNSEEMGTYDPRCEEEDILFHSSSSFEKDSEKNDIHFESSVIESMKTDK
ncbi:Probable metabolite transport protein GIT1 [Galdieria sulphuraria]|nr:Probable metabolite transport protein GIT1 [Galdieria sulphuraria]